MTFFHLEDGEWRGFVNLTAVALSKQTLLIEK